jgi:hypothetical protein
MTLNYTVQAYTAAIVIAALSLLLARILGASYPQMLINIGGCLLCFLLVFGIYSAVTGRSIHSYSQTTSGTLIDEGIHSAREFGILYGLAVIFMGLLLTFVMWDLKFDIDAMPMIALALGAILAIVGGIVYKD